VIEHIYNYTFFSLSYNRKSKELRKWEVISFYVPADEGHSFLGHNAVKIGIGYQCFGGTFCLQRNPGRCYYAVLKKREENPSETLVCIHIASYPRRTEIFDVCNVRVANNSGAFAHFFLIISKSVIRT
jgi:hypothetical protein